MCIGGLGTSNMTGGIQSLGVGITSANIDGVSPIITSPLRDNMVITLLVPEILDARFADCPNAGTGAYAIVIEKPLSMVGKSANMLCEISQYSRKLIREGRNANMSHEISQYNSSPTR